MDVHSSKLTWKWRGALNKITVLYIGPFMSFHVNLLPVVLPSLVWGWRTVMFQKMVESTGAPKDYLNMWILQNMISGIPLCWNQTVRSFCVYLTMPYYTIS